MDGSLTEDEFKQALDMSIDACRRIYEMQREALRQKYHIVKDEADKDAATEVRV
jgi:hypothetical protein